MELLPTVELMERVRGLGVRQAIDVVDNFRWRALRRRAEVADALIAANLTHRLALERRFGRPVTTIEHHHCNFAEERIEPGRRPRGRWATSAGRTTGG